MNQEIYTVTSSGTSSGSRKQRRGKQQRDTQSSLPPLKIPLTGTNIQILRAVLKHRLLTVEQIQRECLPCQEGQSLKGRLEYTRHLLRALYRHKYLLRRELMQEGLGRNPLVFASTWEGAKAVAQHDDCDPHDLGWDPHDKVITWSNENLHHLVAENNVYFTFRQACALADVELRTWMSDRALHQEHKGKKVRYAGPHGGTYHKVIIPDGFYEFARPIEANGRTGIVHDRITVEVDMGTQTLRQRQKTIKHPQRTWEHKVKAYVAYFQPGGLYEQLYKSTKGRVLTITTSEQRLRNMLQATEDVGGTERFWFTTFTAFTQETALTKPIYVVATQGQQRLSLFINYPIA